mmetsp:Transcript_17527/g.27121  ORF Transcript_17527/g.27121 Transcript_17527/m.27121 type:complete len:311 (+) Transcript_17527:42-974(+)
MPMTRLSGLGSAAALLLLGLSAADAFAPQLSFPSVSLMRQKAARCSTANLEMSVERPKMSPEKAAVLGAALISTLLPSPGFADYSPAFFNQLPAIPLAVAQNLPDGWEAIPTADGREYYYNVATKKSQWELPQGAEKTKEVKVNKKKAGNLNQVEPFQTTEVTVDRVTSKAPVKPEGECGTTDFRSNSIECGQPAQGPIADIADKSIGTLQTITDQKKLQKKVQTADERNRMLQAAEQKSLENSDLYKKLYAKTVDPERAAQRQQDIDEVTRENGAGAFKAPWDKPDDYEPPKLELPKLELKMPSLPKLF